MWFCSGLRAGGSGQFPTAQSPEPRATGSGSLPRARNRALDRGNLLHPALVPSPGLEGCRTPRFYDSLCHRLAQFFRSQHQHVGIVVAPASLRVKAIAADGRTDPRDLVRRNRDADAGLAQENPPLEGALRHCGGHLVSNDRVIAGLCCVRAQIGHRNTVALEPRDEPPLQFEAAMIRPDGEPAHGPRARRRRVHGRPSIVHGRLPLSMDYGLWTMDTPPVLVHYAPRTPSDSANRSTASRISMKHTS